MREPSITEFLLAFIAVMLVIINHNIARVANNVLSPMVQEITRIAHRLDQPTRSGL